MRRQAESKSQAKHQKGIAKETYQEAESAVMMVNALGTVERIALEAGEKEQRSDRKQTPNLKYCKLRCNCLTTS